MTDTTASRGTPLRTMHLTGYGQLAWSDVVKHLQGLTCAWADYEGFHVKRDGPTTAPPYTHVWAWKDDDSLLVRVRIDDDQGIVGTLSVDPPSENYKSSSSPVEVRAWQSLPWGDDGQLGRRYGREITQRRFTLYEPLIPLPATFVGGASGTDVPA